MAPSRSVGCPTRPPSSGCRARVYALMSASAVVNRTELLALIDGIRAGKTRMSQVAERLLKELLS